MRHLTLEGSPRNRGLVHGKTWAKEIHELAAIRSRLLRKALDGWSEAKISALATAHLKVLERDGELWAEFVGICEGAKISQVELMILNNHTDLRDFATGDFDEELLEILNECSCFAVKTSEGIIAGQTWDMHGTACPYVAHLTIKKENLTQEVFTLTGCLGLTGVNSCGLGVFINNLRSKEIAVGLAWPALIRKVLDQNAIVDAVECVKANMPSGGRNFILTNNSEAISLEVTGKRLASFGDLEKNFLIHTNHYLTELKASEELGSRSKTTLDRLEYLRAELSKLNLSTVTLDRLAQELFTKPGSEKISIACAPETPDASATCGGMVYDFAEQKGISFAGQFKKQDCLKFQL